MDFMLLIVIFAILLFVFAIAHYQWMVKRHQKALFGKGGVDQEIISLDDEETNNQDYAPTPSKSFILGTMGILILVFFYYFFFYTPTGADGDFTYDELGMQALCEKVVEEKGFEREANALLLLPPYLLNEYISLEEGKKHPFVDNVLIESILTKGRRFTIAGVASSAPFFSARSNQDNDYSLTPTALRDILKKYDVPIKVVICLGGYKMDSQVSGKAGDRSFYLAVFGDKPSFYPYLDMAKDGAFDLALISKGAYNINQAAPDSVAPAETVDTHFLYITPQNERFLRTEYRQYIGVYPPSKNKFCK